MERSFSQSPSTHYGVWDPHPSAHETVKPFSAGLVPVWSTNAPSYPSSFPISSFWVMGAPSPGDLPKAP